MGHKTKLLRQFLAKDRLGEKHIETQTEKATLTVTPLPLLSSQVAFELTYIIQTFLAFLHV